MVSGSIEGDLPIMRIVGKDRTLSYLKGDVIVGVKECRYVSR